MSEEKTTIEKLEQENALLKKKLETVTKKLLQSYEELNLAYEIAETFGTVLDLRKVNNLIIQKASEVSGATMGWLIAKREDDIRISKLYNTDQSFAEKVDDIFVQKILDSRSTMIINDLSEYVEIDKEAPAPPKAFIGVPLINQNKILGAVCLCKTVQDEIFTTAEAKLLKVLCDHSSTSFRNALRFHDLAEKTRKDLVKQ